MLLAADVGGTKALLGLFEPAGDRPAPRAVHEYATLDFDGLDELVATFLDETGARDVAAVCIGVAGPVSGLRARLTNVPWIADATPIVDRLPDARVLLVNDLEAMAYSVSVLQRDELRLLQPGTAAPGGN